MFARTSIRRPVTTIMVMLIAILGGLVAYTSLNLDLMPKMDIPIAIVSTTYPGAGPEEIETLVTKPLEESLGAISNVDTLSSTSSAGSSMIMVMFNDKTDVDLAAVDMREKVDMVKGYLPSGCNDPMVLKIDIESMTALYVGFKSDALTSTELNNLTKDTLVRRFEKIEGVTSVSIMGGDEQEVEISLNSEKMQGYGLSQTLITQALSSENISYPVGSVSQGSEKIQVKTEGKFTSVDEIRDLPITTPLGSLIHLRDVAEVNIIQKDKDSYTIIDGHPALLLVIQKQSNANIVDISEKVNKEIAKVLEEYPQLSSSMLSDTSEYIKTSVNNIISTAFQAAVLAILVIFVFLRSGKISFIIGVSIPTSIITTLAAMWVAGMSMNMISMGGLAIGIGMLVDNSIVVLENIYSHMKLNPDPKEAAARGTNEVAMAVTASTLTTMGVFVPLMFTGGIIGDIFKDLTLAICFSLFASLIVSLTFVPMACSKMLKAEMFLENKEEKDLKGINKFFAKWEKGFIKMEDSYKKLLFWCLGNKKKVVAVVMVIFIGTLSLLPIMGFDFMPDMDEGVVSINVSLPRGSAIEETEKVVDKVIAEIDGISEVETSYAMIGSMGYGQGQSDSATLMLNLINKKDRTVSSKTLAKQLDDRFKDFAGCEISVSASSMAMGSYGDSGVVLRITGDENDILREIGNDLEKLLMEIDGVLEVNSSAGDILPEAKIVMKREKASMYGVSAAQVATTLSNAINGNVATQFKIDGTEIDVRIRQNKENTKYLNDFKNLTVTSQRGVVIPITELADIVMDESSVSITRNNHHRYIDVTIKSYGRDMKSIQRDVESKLDTYIMPKEVTHEFTGTLEEMNDSFQKLGLALVIAVLLVYMIMASQFESLIYPFIIMFSIPISLTGGILGLFVTGKSITVVAFLGFIMLVGMVVNNGIVLVDAANQNVGRGMTSFEAILKAGPDRLRPILMTTLTTVLGMVPLGLAMSEGMEMQQPMAISIIFGLSLSTLVTLILIPVIYMLVDKYRIRNRAENKRIRQDKKANKKAIKNKKAEI